MKNWFSTFFSSVNNDQSIFDAQCCIEKLEPNMLCCKILLNFFYYLPCYINCICEFSFHHEYFVYVSWGYPKSNRLVGKNHTQNLFVLHVQLFCEFEVDKIGRMFFHKGHSYSLLFFRELAWCVHSNWPCWVILYHKFDI